MSKYKRNLDIEHAVAVSKCLADAGFIVNLNGVVVLGERIYEPKKVVRSFESKQVNNKSFLNKKNKKK